MNYRNEHLYFCLALLLMAGCGVGTASQVDNPVADGLRAQAHELNQESQACQEGVAEYRVQRQASLVPESCGDSGFVQAGLSYGTQASDCVGKTLAAVPACRRWADSYQAMVASDGGGGVRAQEEVSQMETQMLERNH